jgi:protein phosphatase
MLLQDWIIALLVTAAATLVMFAIGRRLEGSSVPAGPAKPASPSGPPGPRTTPTPSMPIAPMRSPSSSVPNAIAQQPYSGPPQPAAARVDGSGAGGGGHGVARLAAEDDEDVDPTRIAAQKPSGPERAAERERPTALPKIVPIIHDPEVRLPETEATHFLVHARAQTDPGLRRKRNEDSLLVLEQAGVFVVADGMGGYAGGEVASATAVQTIEQAYRRRTFAGIPHDLLPADASELARSIQMANDAILETARRNPDLTGMGTTVCAARFSDNLRRLYIGHVGDSRCYRLRGGLFRQITRDHTMADHGATGAEARQLSRAVGVWPTVPVDVVIVAPVVGDVYLLCSDGLTKMLDDEDIGEVLAREEDPRVAVETLVTTANSHGGKDNISVILVRVVPPSWSPRLRS